MTWFPAFHDIWIYSLSLGSVTGLYRHAVKGLSADTLEQVFLEESGTFPNDRRFALLKQSSSATFEAQNPTWIHKENFLCAFTNPHLMARYRSSFSAKGDDDNECDPLLSRKATTQTATADDRILNLWERSTNKHVLGPLDMFTERGRQDLAEFFSEKAGSPLVCVTANNDKPHQFGNTSSGWKQKKDTRTIHIVHESTVRALEEAAGVELFLNPTRFRPNIVLSGGTNHAPFSEFDWVGKSLRCGSNVQLEVISKTVRCPGASVDPLDPETTLDIPKLLQEHFPEHGPYLGVYAVVEREGLLSMGDHVSLVEI